MYEYSPFMRGFRVGYKRGCESKEKQGEWIICYQDDNEIHKIKCPFCKYQKGSDANAFAIVTFTTLPKFCENCGARLTEGKGEEE